MAKSSTSVYGFEFRQSLIGLEHPAVQEFILDDSATFTLGDMVRIDTDGLLVVNGVGNTILGLLVGIVDQNGINVFSPRAQGVAGATLTPDDTIATSSTNSSDGTRKLKGQVIVDPAGTNLYYNDTNGDLTQSMVGAAFDLTSAGDRIDQGTPTDATAQMQLLEIDPDGDGDASKGLFRIVEEQY
jgi:hypothetical protein